MRKGRIEKRHGAWHLRYRVNGKQISSLVGRKIEIQDRTDGVDLMIRVGASGVDVLIVGVELDVPGEREKAPGEEASNAPFGMLALVLKSSLGTMPT